uniref:Membrane protein insertase YidC n=1 Tax=uncultured SAR11 cluster alpha proteobacterium H17925_23J24 TaxID=715036 RepID=E7C9X2_9PROT|nr:preprotein translocase subunit YidC [uncultured SAR11 cluster alpha proteobacterium H17925_23J24]
MDFRNVIFAIALSFAVLFGWSVIFETPKIEEQAKLEQSENYQKEDAASDAPSVNVEKKDLPIVSRNDAIKSTNRINFENENVVGSITLKGALIDDITFKKYNETLGSDKKVTYLNPQETNEGYFIETGWAASNVEDIGLPNKDTLWKVKGNNKLSTGSPVIMEWKNKSGITFRKKIELDSKFLFRVTQEIQNKSGSIVELYPYAQITRNQKPVLQAGSMSGTLILHDGFIGVFNEDLKEYDYDDIKDKKKEHNAESGWLGITDKFWITALVPEKNQSFRGEFVYKSESFKANYIANKPIVVQPSSSKASTTKIFVAAKEVKVIDGYAEAESINKFDLTIDWGWLYFLTKPLFFIINYLFELTKNFGIAIILVTAAVRLLFFPLANYSFRSMAKMKILQPELLRLKEVHKGDKVKLQQEMMALYRREKVNPLSGCLPILIQIPFFFAIYKMLLISLEMRHQPFFGWIKDLSAQDPTSIFNIFGLIPWDPPSFLIIGAWPIMMGATMYLQQKLNPTPPDPIQAKIFLFFPLFLTIILAPFPAGLVVYWTINNVLTIAQQWVIMKRTTVKTK